MARPWARARPHRLSFLLGGDDPENRLGAEIPAKGFGGRRHWVHVAFGIAQSSTTARSGLFEPSPLLLLDAYAILSPTMRLSSCKHPLDAEVTTCTARCL